jgi:glycosyltransferase involved in cell wall biosynthesis
MKIVQTVAGKFHHFELARELHKSGWLETIFSSYPWWKLKHENIPHAKVKTFPWLQTPMMGAMKAGWSLGSSLDRELLWRVFDTLDTYAANHLPECDVFVGLSGSGLETGRLAKKRGAKYICDRGSSHIRYQDRILKEEYKIWGQEYLGIDQRITDKEEAEYALADFITVPSGFVLNSFIEMSVDPKKLRQVSYGANLTRFEKIGDPPKNTFEVLFVGQVSFRKGVPYLLEAFSRFKHPNKRLRIAGTIRPEMASFLKSKHLEHVEFLGHVPSLKLKEIMSTSHVMVLPSIEEGLALVQGQALACGCPLISSVNTGGEDLFEHEKEGFIVPIRNVEAIKARLEQLADDPVLWEAMSGFALNRVKELRGWEGYGDRFKEVCNELIATV